LLSLREPEQTIYLAPSLAANVGYLLHRAFQRLQALAATSAHGQHQGRELAIVARLLATGPQPQHELANALTINRSVMVHLLDELEAIGFVARERNPSDRRSHLVSATPAGALALEGAAPALREADGRLTARLSAASRERLFELLGQFAGAALPDVVAPISQTVSFRVARAHFLIAAAANTALVPVGLDVREYGLLTSVHDMAPCSQQQLATLLDVSGPVIVELVDGLDARGLIVRERNPDDRRSYALRLTAEAEPLLAGARDAVRGVLAQTSERLGAGGLEDLARLLAEMLGAQVAAA